VIRRLEVPLVVGSGVAGLSTALGLDAAVVVSGGALGSTWWAQGGIAAAVGRDDQPALHAADTMAVAGGLAIRDAVDMLTAGGPEAIQRLVDIGARFDHDEGGDLALGREAGHQRRRIVHADGDRTGLEVMRTLTEEVISSDRIEVLEGWRALDLATASGRVVGLVAADPGGERHLLLAPAVVLATGGIGRVYSRTTNPAGVTGDGLAMAARIGVRLADLEFVQFHPTALDAGTDPMPLLTEALRGEGAHLVDSDGQRFMLAHHPDAELAPRDVVARAIFWQQSRGDGAFLDARSIGDFPTHFPTVLGIVQAAGLDPGKDLLPVSPAAHYYMGGIDAVTEGRSSLPGLWAVGEVASTGVHGANRLASNSLLEGLVFGARVAIDVAARMVEPPAAADTPPEAWNLPMLGDGIDEVRTIMWERAGLVRTGPGLWEARNRLLDLDSTLRSSIAGRVAADVARLVVAAALRRSESRGGHYRADYPESDVFQDNRNLIEPIPSHQSDRADPVVFRG
jgi:L-aspartate oxidase